MRMGTRMDTNMHTLILTVFYLMYLVCVLFLVPCCKWVTVGSNTTKSLC